MTEINTGAFNFLCTPNQRYDVLLFFGKRWGLPTDRIFVHFYVSFSGSGKEKDIKTFLKNIGCVTLHKIPSGPFYR